MEHYIQEYEALPSTALPSTHVPLTIEMSALHGYFFINFLQYFDEYDYFSMFLNQLRKMILTMMSSMQWKPVTRGWSFHNGICEKLLLLKVSNEKSGAVALDGVATIYGRHLHRMLICSRSRLPARRTRLYLPRRSCRYFL